MYCFPCSSWQDRCSSQCFMIFCRIPCSYSLTCHPVLASESWVVVNILSFWVKGFSVNVELNLTLRSKNTVMVREIPHVQKILWWLEKSLTYCGTQLTENTHPPPYDRWLRMSPCLPITKWDTGSPDSHSLPAKCSAKQLLQSTDQSGNHTQFLTFFHLFTLSYKRNTFFSLTLMILAHLMV